MEQRFVDNKIKGCPDEDDEDVNMCRVRNYFLKRERYLYMIINYVFNLINLVIYINLMVGVNIKINFVISNEKILLLSWDKYLSTLFI